MIHAYYAYLGGNGRRSASRHSTVAGSSQSTPATAHGGFWTRAKERSHYWLLLAQLNPAPVALGAMLLVFIIMLLLFQRRRARATRRVKTVTKSPDTPAVAEDEAVAGNETETALSAETATVVAAGPSPGLESLPVTPPFPPAATMPPAAAVQHWWGAGVGRL